MCVFRLFEITPARSVCAAAPVGYDHMAGQSCIQLNETVRVVNIKCVSSQSILLVSYTFDLNEK